MRVLFDFQIFLLQKYGGISRYYIELFKHLKRLENCEPTLDVPLKICNYKMSTNGEIKSSINIKFKKLIKPALFASGIYYSHKYRKPKHDLLHRTYFNKWINKPKIKSVMTIYDIIPEKVLLEKYGYFRVDEKKDFFFKNVDHIIAISQHTKDDLVEYYKVKEKDISVVHLGLSFERNRVNDIKEKKRWILYVGNRRGYKNFDLLLNAFKDSKLFEDYKLIIFGGEKPSKEEIKVIEKFLKGNNRFSFVEGTEEQLIHYYTKSEIFVYTSLFEGFGLPPLEAMNFGCKVLSSNIPSIVEVFGDNIQLFNPYSKDDLVQKLEIVVEKNAMDLFSKNYLPLIKKYHWESCAIKTLEVYDKTV